LSIVGDLEIRVGVTGTNKVEQELKKIEALFRDFQQRAGSFGGSTGVANSLQGLSQGITQFSARVSDSIQRVNALTRALERAAAAGSRLGGSIQQGPAVTNRAAQAAGVGTVAGAPRGGGVVAPFPIPTGKIVDPSKRGFWHDMLYAGGFMMRYQAITAAMEAASYVAQYIGMGKSREDLVAAGDSLRAIGLKKTQIDYMEKAAIKLSKRLPGIKTKDFFLAVSEIGSAIDPEELGVEGLVAGGEAAALLHKMGKVPMERGSKLVSSIYTALHKTPRYAAMTPAEGLRSVGTTLASAIKVTPAWAADIEGMGAHALPMIKYLGWDLETALGFGGAMKAVGHKMQSVGRFTKTMATDKGYDTLMRIFFAGGEQDLGAMDVRDPKTSKWLEGLGYKKPAQKKAALDDIKYNTRGQFEEMMRYSPLALMYEMNERLKKAQERGTPLSYMIPTQQWTSMFLAMGQELDQVMGPYVERMKKEVAAGPTEMEKPFTKSKYEEIGVAYSALSLALDRLVEVSAKSETGAKALGKLSDIIESYNEKMMLNYIARTGKGTPQGRSAARQLYQLGEEDFMSFPGFIPMLAPPTHSNLFRSVYGIAKLLGLTTEAWDAKMQSRSSDMMGILARKGILPDSWTGRGYQTLGPEVMSTIFNVLRYGVINTLKGKTSTAEEDFIIRNQMALVSPDLFQNEEEIRTGRLKASPTRPMIFRDTVGEDASNLPKHPGTADEALKGSAQDLSSAAVDLKGVPALIAAFVSKFGINVNELKSSAGAYTLTPEATARTVPQLKGP